MTHAIAPRASWLGMPRVLVPIGVATALVFLVFAAALSAEGSTEETLARAQADLAVTREAISAHSSTMRAQGERLLQVTTSSVSPHRDHWTSHAQQMIADASRLVATAKLIESQARLLGEHPGRTVRSDLTFVHSVGDGLVAEGDGLVTHGQAIREHGLAMEELARTSEMEIAPTDVALLRDGADRLIDTGARTRTVGAVLQSVGGQFMRSLGR